MPIQTIAATSTRSRAPEYALVIGIAIALLVSGGMLLGLVPSPF